MVKVWETEYRRGQDKVTFNLETKMGTLGKEELGSQWPLFLENSIEREKPTLLLGNKGFCVITALYTFCPNKEGM